MRRNKLDSLSSPEVANAYDGLYARAIEEYGAKCLWNINAQSTDAVMDIIAEQLMKYGDFKAWKLAALIKERIGRAVRFHETVGLK
jgi:hypothetical protein